MYIETNEALNNITDDSTFHQLACEILKINKPEYFCLENTGLNQKGKSKKSPFDSYGWIGNTFIGIEYTTTENSGERLKNKWLNEKQTKTRPLGDLVKSINEIEKLRKKFPKAKFKIVLCSNRKINTKLDEKVREYIQKHDINIEIYWQDFFQGILDNDADGQYIRAQYLGITQNKLSKKLLQPYI